MFVEAAIVVDSKRSSHSTEALITENNKNLFCCSRKKKYFFKKVAVKMVRNQKYVEIISSDQIDSSSKILIKGVLIWLTKNKVWL
jgi:hypothetical protein